MTRGKRCIVDATVLLDFIEGDIFNAFFSLPFEFLTSDIVAGEVSRSYSQDELTSRGLIIVELEEDEVLEIAALQSEHVALSPNDLSVYLLARKRSSLLISGDGPLRNLADFNEVEYHGTLWVLEEMVERKILSQQNAASALRTMLAGKRWLPRAECDKLIKKWESE
jgi:predicted nucleic acid-binding protein